MTLCGHIKRYKNAYWYVTIQTSLGKACHLLVKLENNAYWAIKQLNFDAKAVSKKRLLQLNELEEFQLNAYESSRLYKEKTKRLPNKKILARTFQLLQQVLLYNSKLRLFPGKLKSRWSGPFTVVRIHSHGL
ncbi:uncharacterized protein LOC114759161 [Neltuma alba]|uniref:uncharacterized protein LOC114759161 n=1 Tax=Neltuma alba TaxID=207710 RepID=UPI0010A579A4|nr:uncharacterized protein LOC114759161 [Prosopis alba]